MAGDLHDVEDVHAGQAIDGLVLKVRHLVVVFLQNGQQLLLAGNTDFGAGLLLVDVDVRDVLGPDDGFGLAEVRMVRMLPSVKTVPFSVRRTPALMSWRNWSMYLLRVTRVASSSAALALASASSCSLRTSAKTVSLITVRICSLEGALSPVIRESSVTLSLSNFAHMAGSFSRNFLTI